jgi:hypothetical protein
MVSITKRTFSRKISVSFSSGELNLRDNEEFEVLWISISHPSGYCVLILWTGLSYTRRLPFRRDWTELSVVVVSLSVLFIFRFPLRISFWISSGDSCCCCCCCCCAITCWLLIPLLINTEKIILRSNGVMAISLVLISFIDIEQ